MGSFERKMKRQALKQGHNRFKKQWKAENERRMGQMVPVEQAPSTSSGEANPVADTPTTASPMVPMRPMPLLGRAPTLGQYRKMVENAQLEKLKNDEAKKLEFIKNREEEEKQLAAQEWKEQ